MKSKTNNINNNIFVSFFARISSFFKSIFKFLNKSLFEVKSINIYVQDVVVFLIGILVILVSIHYLKKSFKHPVKTVKIIHYKAVAPVPVEKWDYIKYFTYDNDQYVPALNSKSDTYYSYTRKLPAPITSDAQKNILNVFHSTIRSKDVLQATTLNSFVNYNSSLLNSPLQQIVKTPFDLNNFVNNHKIVFEQPKLNQAPKAPTLHWYCGPYLVVDDALNYLSRVNQVAQFSGFGDVYTNNKFYYVKVSRELNPTEVKVLARYYHLNCEINLNLDSYHEYVKSSDNHTDSKSQSKNTKEDDSDNGNDLIGLDSNKDNTVSNTKTKNKIRKVH